MCVFHHSSSYSVNPVINTTPVFLDDLIKTFAFILSNVGIDVQCAQSRSFLYWRQNLFSNFSALVEYPTDFRLSTHMAHQNQNPNEAHRKHCYTYQRTGANLQQVAGVLRGFSVITKIFKIHWATKMKIKLTVNMLTQLSRLIPPSPVGCARWM